MKVVHLPNTHWYQRSLQSELCKNYVECDAATRPWGLYLPNIVDDILAARVDVVHLHWPESLFRQPVQKMLNRILSRAYLYSVSNQEEWGRWIYEMHMSLQKLKSSNCRVVWTIHNSYPHNGENCSEHELLYETIAFNADGVIHHSQWGMREIAKRYAFRERTVQRVIPFGFFPDMAPSGLTKNEARAILDISREAFVMLNVGTVTIRKRLNLIAEAVGKIRDFECILMVVGECDATTINHLSVLARERIRFAGQLADDKLAVYAKASDVLGFAPNSDQLTTGGPHLSLTYGLPQITTDTPYVREVLGDDAFYAEPTVKDLNKTIVKVRNILSVIASREKFTHRLLYRRAGQTWSDAASMTKELYERITDTN